MMNRFVKFHGRAQSEGAENSLTSETAPRRSFPQRHVTAHALPGNLPEGVICLSLWVVYLLIHFLPSIVINASSSRAFGDESFYKIIWVLKQGTGKWKLHTPYSNQAEEIL